jgi:hypothetical protein
LTRLVTGQQAAAFNLQPSSLSVDLLEGIISGLPRRGQFDAKKTGSFVLGNLTSDTQRLRCASCVHGFLDDPAFHFSPSDTILATIPRMT